MKTSTHPAFRLMAVVLLPLFFFFHEWNTRFAVMRFTDFFDLWWKHTLGCLVLYFILTRWIKHPLKAWWVAMLTIFVYLFFGNLQDAAGAIRQSLSYAKFFFPLMALVYTGLLFLIIKNRKKLLPPAFPVLLLWVYIGIEIFQLWNNYNFNKNSETKYAVKETAIKPDVFLLVFDEYASSKALSKYWNYNNGAFDSFLSKNRFQLMENSKSNYNFTVFSVPSVLTMNYIPVKLTGNENEKNTYFSAARFAYNSVVPVFFEKEGYHIYNYSYFNLRGHPFIPGYKFHFGDRSIVEETFAGRLVQAIDGVKRKKPWQLANFTSAYEEAHDRINAVRQLLAVESAKPRFVFMHVLAPHPPFLTDSMGRMRPLKQAYVRTASAYRNYVAYWNGEIKKLVTNINSSSKGNAIIIIMGDHGYRDNTLTSPNREHHFMNFLAVHMPGDSNTLLPPINSLVNLFPIVLNNRFGTTFPSREDSSVFLKFSNTP
jgi:hypothetical protein